MFRNLNIYIYIYVRICIKKKRSLVTEDSVCVYKQKCIKQFRLDSAVFLSVILGGIKKAIF